MFAECGAKWETARPRGLALMAVGLAQLGPAHLPPGEWESAWIARYKAAAPAKPRCWPALLMGLRGAAGLEPAEPLPGSPWLLRLLLALGRAWGLQEPPGQAASLAAMLAELNAQLAAVAAMGGGVADAAAAHAEHDEDGGHSSSVNGADAAELAEYLQQLQQQGVDIEPTSATAVLL